MKRKTENSLDELQGIMAFLNRFPLARDLRQARLASYKGRNPSSTLMPVKCEIRHHGDAFDMQQ